LLFLGHSESIIGISRFFETIRFSDCIAYRRAAI
jgi:chemotaxis methyl-accepting protein methylase